jgi:hypothetical protein
MPLDKIERAELEAELRAVLDRYTEKTPPETEPPETEPSGDDWKPLGIEGSDVTVPAGSTIRYGVPGRYAIRRFAAGGKVHLGNSTFGDPAPYQVKSADLWTGVGDPPAETAPSSGGGGQPPQWTPVPLSAFPAAPGSAPLTDAQHEGNLLALLGMDRSGRLAANYIRAGDGGDWYRRNQASVNPALQAATGQSAAQLFNTWTAGNNVLSDDEMTGLARMQGY